jgi:hypothetical protein
MNKFLSILFCAVITASAQNVPVPGDAVTLIGGGTNKVLSVSTSQWYKISSSAFTDVALFADVKYLNAVGSGDVNALRVDIQRGVDANTFESNIWQSITFAANATTTTANSTCTNLSLSAIPYVRIRFANVSTNAHVTNLIVKYRPKEQQVNAR